MAARAAVKKQIFILRRLSQEKILSRNGSIGASGQERNALGRKGKKEYILRKKDVFYKGNRPRMESTWRGIKQCCSHMISWNNYYPQ